MTSRLRGSARSTCLAFEGRAATGIALDTLPCWRTGWHLFEYNSDPLSVVFIARNCKINGGHSPNLQRGPGVISLAVCRRDENSATGFWERV